MWHQDPSLIDRIYEAGAVPELWPGLLDELTALSGGLACTLASVDPERSRWTGSPLAQQLMPDFLASQWPARDSRIQAILAEPYTPSFRTALDYFTEEQLVELPIYQQYLQHHHLEACAATLFQGLDGERLLLAFEGFATQQLSKDMALRFDVLRPHLARAAVLSFQLQLERARAAMAALQLINVPAAMVDGQGRLQLGNDLFCGLMGQRIFDRRDRLHFADLKSDARYVRVLYGLAGGQPGRTLVLRRDAELPMALHVIPVRGSARDVFQRSAAILVLATGSANAAVPPTLLQNLFDLSPAEARVVSLLCDGHRLADVASLCNLSYETARSHLKSAFAKTDTNRQTDMIALLASYTRPPAFE